MDERRRRRLAVTGESAETSDTASGERGPLPDCVPAEFCAAAPWIPRAPWKLWTLAGLMYLGLCALLAVIHRIPGITPEWPRGMEALFQGETPRVVTYLETIFWTLSGQLALLVNWHRSHSKLDFRGRYRFWPWLAACMFSTGFCAATHIHLGLNSALEAAGTIPVLDAKWTWHIPALCLMLPAWLLMDRDSRRSLPAVILFRTSLTMLATGCLLGMFSLPWMEASLKQILATSCGLLGSATLVTALWVQAWYVAYVTPDPPVVTPRTLSLFRWNPLSWLWGLMTGLFRRTPAAEAAKPSRRKKAEESVTTKRKRKPKRKPRTRKVVEEEVDGDEEEEYAEDESGNETAEDSADDESGDEEEEESVPAPKGTVPQTSARSPDRRPPEPSSAADDEDEDDDADDDGRQFRLDGPSQDQLKGLSKRQRRALIKQHRDQQRGR